MIIFGIAIIVLLLVFLYSLISAMITNRALMKIKKNQLLGIMQEWEDFSRRSDIERQDLFHR